MEKEKRIEEMSRVLANASCKGYECENCFFEDKVEVKTNCVCVKALYNAGYRKQEDILHEWVERETAYLNEIAELKKENQRLKELKED